MARTFVAASSQSLAVTSSPVSAVPLTVACWHKPTAINVQRNVLAISLSSSLKFYQLQQRASAICADQYDGTLLGSSTFSSGYSSGSWQHIAGVFTSNSSRTVYLGGVAATTNTTTIGTVTPDRLVLGARNNAGTIDSFFDGDVAEAAVWNIALTASDIAALALAVSPLLVRPDALVFYAPVMGVYSPEIDLMGHRDLTVTGATQATHPRMFRARQMTTGRYGGSSASAGSLARMFQVF